tara:strand:- start:8523 stop:9308 length:786 start_codon:yes stop_codon:yes gene_type:complete
MIKTKSRLFNISSAIGRMNGDFCSQVQVSLPDLTFHLDNIQNAYFSVVHCEVPNSFYIVNYTNNQIVIDGITYTLTRGNYNVNTFITMFASILPQFQLTYNSATTKLTIQEIFLNSFTINASSKASTVNSIMGLGTTDMTGEDNYTMPNVINFIPLQRINFRSNYFNFGCYSTSDNSSDIFLPLQNNAGQNAIINYVNQTQDKFLIQDRSITTFRINVTNDVGQLINFNGVDWLMTIKIDIDYLEIPRQTNFSNLLATRQF